MFFSNRDAGTTGAGFIADVSQSSYPGADRIVGALDNADNSSVRTTASASVKSRPMAPIRVVITRREC